MAWDATLPDGDISIALGDDAIRANNSALETALDLEHRFATGGGAAGQSGRHTFTYDDETAIAALANVAAGSIAFSDDAIAAERPVLRIYDGSVWRYLNPYDPDHITPYINESQSWTRPQNMQWQDVTPGAGSPNTVAIDMALQPFKAVTISADTEIQVPTNQPTAGYSQTVVLQVTNSGAGHVITWASGGGDQYVSSSGIAPIYDDSDGAVNIFQITRLRNNNDFLVTSVLNVGSF